MKEVKDKNIEDSKKQNDEDVQIKLNLEQLNQESQIFKSKLQEIKKKML